MGKRQVTLATHVKSALRMVADFVFPQTCLNCRTEGSLLCARCLAHAERIGVEACPRCALPLESGRHCRKCAQSPPRLSGLRAVFKMEGAIREAVHALKYNDLRAMAPALGSEMANELTAKRSEIDVVVPVPLHPRRMRSRGYNQAEMLARPVAERCGAPIEQELLARLIDTKPQARARSEAERVSRVSGAFAASSAASGKSVLLIDDVATTCSTLDACGRELYKAGAKKVVALVLAREL